MVLTDNELEVGLRKLWVFVFGFFRLRRVFFHHLENISFECVPFSLALPLGILGLALRVTGLRQVLRAEAAIVESAVR